MTHFGSISTVRVLSRAAYPRCVENDEFKMENGIASVSLMKPVKGGSSTSWLISVSPFTLNYQRLVPAPKAQNLSNTKSEALVNRNVKFGKYKPFVTAHVGLTQEVVVKHRFGGPWIRWKLMEILHTNLRGTFMETQNPEDSVQRTIALKEPAVRRPS